MQFFILNFWSYSNLHSLVTLSYKEQKTLNFLFLIKLLIKCIVQNDFW